MIEIPESRTLAKQAADVLAGRTVTDVFNATHPHKFTWYTGDPAAYKGLLAGKKVLSASGYGCLLYTSTDREHAGLAGSDTLFRFEARVADLGRIRVGHKKKIVFRFTNVSSCPVVITRVMTSCECTSVSYTHLDR